jgi:hypothetical protein
MKRREPPTHTVAHKLSADRRFTKRKSMERRSSMGTAAANARKEVTVAGVSVIATGPVKGVRALSLESLDKSVVWCVLALT